MEKIFKKYEILFCISLIFLYLVVNSYCINNIGIYDYRSAVANTFFSLLLVLLIFKLDCFKYYGFIKVKNFKKYLYFIPLVLIISTNLWSGINVNNSLCEIIFFVLNMINVGFIEEVIFLLKPNYPYLFIFS